MYSFEYDQLKATYYFVFEWDFMRSFHFFFFKEYVKIIPVHFSMCHIIWIFICSEFGWFNSELCVKRNSFQASICTLKNASIYYLC